MEKFIVYNNFMGIPEKVVFIDGKWWVISRNETFEQLPEMEFGDDFYRNLCTLDEELTYPDLGCMMGRVMADLDPLKKASEVLENRLNDLRRLGVKFNGAPQQMEVTVKIVKRTVCDERTPYMVSCYDSHDDWQDYFSVYDFHYPEAALMCAREFLSFFLKHGVTIHVTLCCTKETYDEIWQNARDMEFEELDD